MKAIEGNPQCIGDIFRGHEFEIPEFQRPYSWEAEECVQLWDDLSSFLDNADSGQEKYFLGSIVVHPKVSNEKIWRVIDGQQRLITLLILVKALFEKATTHTVLEKIIYKEDPITGETKIGDPRIQSLVYTKTKETGETDKDSFSKILDGKASELKVKSLFRLNYELLQKLLSKWWNSKTTGDREKIIEALQKDVVMLPIQCSTEDDALTLFQTINDRGRPLDDSDIFKAKIYNAIPENDRNDFIKRWDEIKKHEDLFRLYMHISRAGKNDTTQEIALRKYILDHHLKNQQELAQNYKTIMDALEACHWLAENNSSEDKKISDEENIYWGIMKTYPNTYWHYPLHVFLHKYMKCEGGRFDLPKERHDEYLKLMKETVRYFFIKGVTYKNVNRVKDTTFKVCVAIDQEESYTDEYRKNIDKEDLEIFYRKLANSDCGRRYTKGLIFLNSSLNSEQNRADYGNALKGKIDIEHILPKKWNNYDNWTVDSHEKHINNIGNLMPLEKIVNSKASNEFFSHKMEEYKESKIQDALDLSTKNPAHWYPENVEQRQEEARKRLVDFFK